MIADIVVDASQLIRTHRLAAGLSQRELARRAGTSSATLHRYESGAVDPSTGTLNRLLRACLPRRRRWASLAELAPAIAGSLARKQPTPASAGTFPTNTPLFTGLLLGVIVIVVGLTFFPAVSLGPIVEHLTGKF